ncbi:MAG: class I SAM-dependent DNA methyltransferase [Kiritimatiellaeota bacterium]|nr:class I SAM-dependent DNA methyltransferase [Kiritimatiellota bacterium]
MLQLSWNEVRDRAVRFAKNHANDASEKAEKQTFWNEFFDVFGLRRASYASFEFNVRNLKGNYGSIDLLWRGKLLVEHKSKGESLDAAEIQAFHYIEDLTNAGDTEAIPQFILVSDFQRFVLYDTKPPEKDLPLFQGRPIATYRFTLADLPRHIHNFAFMLGQTHFRTDPEDPANQKAYARMCQLHDDLKAGGYGGADLERLLVRILFCLFAEDTGLFAPEAFTHYIRMRTREDGDDLGGRLNELFDWLNRPEADAHTNDEAHPFCGFRYVNGGLFAERLGFPRYNKAMRTALIACCEFCWAKISPAVFGSLFQGILSDKERRQQGAHYTSERDILKVVRSLFLDDLQAEWTRIQADGSNRQRAAMDAFREKLRHLKFLDPACGCGNFLVIAYRELRLLEIEVLRKLSEKSKGQQFLPSLNVDQFFGIEYAEWPVRIAEVALWLMDHQMNIQASEVLGQPLDRLPLKTSPSVVQGNALRLDWNKVLPASQCSFVLGNPPFVGKKERNAEQKADMDLVWGNVAGSGVLDYVTCWYRQAADYINSTKIAVGFVSTNSITMGEQVGILWNELFNRRHVKILFAHRTFRWTSEARGKAQVHVVIVGFGCFDIAAKKIFDYEIDEAHANVSTASNISPYLVAGSDLYLSSRGKPICLVPEIMEGSALIDDGHFLMDDEEARILRAEYPVAKNWLRPFYSGEEFINGHHRWCLWLVDVPPQDLRSCPPVMARVENIRDFRQKSAREATRVLAAVPREFGEVRQPRNQYLFIPKTSTERRTYIPIDFMPAKAIINNTSLFIDGAEPFHFGILSSQIHMAWMRAVCGRLKSDYRYSNKIVYNNYPWPSPTPEQRVKVEEKAQAVLEARARHLPPRGLATLADLYDPNTMPPELVKAHAELDRAVEKCYRPEKFLTDRERVEFLFSLYEKLTAPLLPATPKIKTRRSAGTTPREVTRPTTEQKRSAVGPVTSPGGKAR